MSVVMIKDFNKLVVSFAGLFLVWLYVVHSSLWSAIEIWIGNEIYNHCLVVIPASIFLIYEKRNDIDWSKLKMSWLAVICFIAQLAFYILATAADIQLFQHIAVFSMLSTLFWIFVGNKIAWELKFPLFFVLFAVPVGEELIPFLQEITADMSVFMLKLTGIPLYRSGLFIEIPQGKFLVAEACSGVSFLIASVVLGNLYAYMNLRSLRRRFFFLILSIAFPIFANAVRVYGIIYIGYSTDMEHAVGADHLIYGWFFFAFVLVCLFLIGEVIRRNEVKKLQVNVAQNTEKTKESFNLTSVDSVDVNTPTVGSNKLKVVVIVIVLLNILLTEIQVNRMDALIVSNDTKLELNLNGFSEESAKYRLKWVPRYIGNNQEKMYFLSNGEFNFNTYFAYFDGSKGELVSSLHRLYEQDRWTRESRQQSLISGKPVITEVATSSIGVKKEIVYWYVVDNKIMNTYRDVKIHQLLQKLRGNPSFAMVIAVASDIDRNSPSRREILNSTAESILLNNAKLFGN